MIETFDPLRMLVLLTVTTAFGFMMGDVLTLWNIVHKKPAWERLAAARSTSK